MTVVRIAAAQPSVRTSDSARMRPRAHRFDEFREACASKLLERSPQEEVARAFQLFDLGANGHISAADLRVIAKQLQVG